MTSEQFINQYSIYKNEYGKISPYVYILTKYSDELNNLLTSEQLFSTKQALLRQYVEDSFYTLPSLAKSLKISSKIFDYVGPANLKKIDTKVLHNKSISKAISALYMAGLAGDNLSVLSTA